MRRVEASRVASRNVWRKAKKQSEKQYCILFNVNPMLLALNEILSMRFNNDFVGKKDILLILLFILFYSNPTQKIQIRWFIY